MKQVYLGGVPLIIVVTSTTAVALFFIIILLLQTRQVNASIPVEARAINSGAPSVFLPLIVSPAGTCYYAETNDAVVIEIESIPAVEEWHLETSFPDFTGAGYYVWRGPDYWDITQAGNAILTYPISLTKSGTYRLNIRNSHPQNPSLFNDVWVRLDGRDWIKGFSNIIDSWTYDFNFDRGGGNLTTADFENVQPGLHTLELSARSHGFRLDRLVLSTNGMGQLDTWPESPCEIP